MNRYAKELRRRFGLSKADATDAARIRVDTWRIPHRAPVHYSINERATLAARIAAVAENGRVGVIVAGMDCDCSQYRREIIRDVPSNFFKYWHDLYEAEQWLDGPQSIAYVRPTEARDGYHRSSDRALEAYEDGHPHRVTWTNLD